MLQLEKFQLRINDKVFEAEPPSTTSLSAEDKLPGSTEQIKKFEDVRAMIGALHSSLHVEEYQLEVEQDLVRRLEDINAELTPLEKVNVRIEAALKDSDDLVRDRGATQPPQDFLRIKKFFAFWGLVLPYCRRPVKTVFCCGIQTKLPSLVGETDT